MKSLLYIVAIFSFALVSCTERLPENNMPNDVENGAITMVSAAVKPLYLKGVTGVGNYKWSNINLGIVSAGDKNECYQPVKATTGDSEAYFYGNEVGGDLSIYMPYSEENGAKAKEGKLTMLSEQNYYADPFDHLMYNSTFLATTTENRVEFDYYSGLAKVLLKHDVNDIASVTLRIGNISVGEYDDYLAGDYSIADATIDGAANGNIEAVVKIDEAVSLNSTVENPACVYVALAPGVYQHFVVIITTRSGESILLPVEGKKLVEGTTDQYEAEPFVIERCAISKDVVAEKIDRNNGVDDFEHEDGNFNEQ